MSSYSSTSSFLSGSDASTSPGSDAGSHFPHTSPEFALSQPPIQEEEPLDHPLLSSLNLHETVVDSAGFPVMQTKSAWMKQKAILDREEAKKAKKLARKMKNGHMPKDDKPPVVLSKKEKKAKKNQEDLAVDEDA